MSGASNEDAKKQEPSDNPKLEGDNSSKVANQSAESSMPSPQQEADVIKKKYGGMMPKKPPLISKDHERAYFDSADWALGKQGAQKPKGPLEALRPKLQPTPHHQARSRHSAYSSTDNDDDAHNAFEDPSMIENDPCQQGSIALETSSSTTTDSQTEPNMNNTSEDPNMTENDACQQGSTALEAGSSTNTDGETSP